MKVWFIVALVAIVVLALWLRPNSIESIHSEEAPALPPISGSTVPVPPVAKSVGLTAPLGVPPTKSEETVEEIVAQIGVMEANMERSGLLPKARTATLTDEEERELAKYIEAVLELREREIKTRMRQLQARLDRMEKKK